MVYRSFYAAPPVVEQVYAQDYYPVVRETVVSGPAPVQEGVVVQEQPVVEQPGAVVREPGTMPQGPEAQPQPQEQAVPAPQAAPEQAPAPQEPVQQMPVPQPDAQSVPAPPVTTQQPIQPHEPSAQPQPGAAQQGVIPPGATQETVLPPDALPSVEPVSGIEQPTTSLMPPTTQPTTAPAIAASEVEAYLAEGENAFMRGAYDEARRLFVRAVLADTNHGPAKLDYALAHYVLGDYRVASMAVRRGLTAWPEGVENGQINLLLKYGLEGDFEAHLAKLVKHLEANPTDADAWLVRGYVELFGGKRAAAKESLKKVVDLTPNDTIAQLLYDAAQGK